MKKTITTILVAILSLNVAIPSIATADNCDWSTIVELPSHSYAYTPELHLCVGNLVQENKVQLTQIGDLQTAIQLKDLALTTADTRTQNWMKTADDEQDRLSKIESTQKTNDFLYFGLGVLTAVASGWMAARLLHP